MKRFVMWLFALLLFPCALSAQEVPADAKLKLAELAKKGDVEQVVAQTAELLNGSAANDPFIPYIRGYVKWVKWKLEDAQKDFEPLQGYRPWGNWPTATQMVNRITMMRTNMPKLYKEIKDGDTVAFNVRYEEDEEWTRLIIANLPEAFKTVSDAFGLRLPNTGIFIFTDRDRYSHFHEGLFGYGPSPVSFFAEGRAYLFYIRPQRRDGTGPATAASTSVPFLRMTMTSSYVRALLLRTLYKSKLPKWLEMGLAEWVGFKYVSNAEEELGNRLNRSIASKKILTLDEMNALPALNLKWAITWDGKLNPGGDLEFVRPDSATQAVQMIGYLVAHSKPGQFYRFLNLMGEGSDFKPAFLDAFGQSADTFYSAWLADATRKYERWKAAGN